MEQTKEGTFLTVRELAERWGCTTKTIYNLRAAHKAPPAFMVGNGLRFRVSDLEAWESAQVQQCTPEPTAK